MRVKVTIKCSSIENEKKLLNAELSSIGFDNVDIIEKKGFDGGNLLILIISFFKSDKVLELIDKIINRHGNSAVEIQKFEQTSYNNGEKRNAIEGIRITGYSSKSTEKMLTQIASMVSSDLETTMPPHISNPSSVVDCIEEREIEESVTAITTSSDTDDIMSIDLNDNNGISV